MGRATGGAAGAILLMALAAAGAGRAQEAPVVPDAPPAMLAPPSEAPDSSTVPAIAPAPAAPETLRHDAPLSPAEPAPAPTPAAAVLPHDLSPWGMFMAADAVVKGVMLGLAFASLVTWTVCVAKSLELLLAGARLRRSLRAILEARDLEAAERALVRARDPAASMVHAARREAAATAPHARGGLLPRVSSHLGRIEAAAGRRLAVGTGLLATIGATAPFVGLFGTVWGIMNSFIGISESQTTNLAVVAPGIAEALLATALGLVAAIPAVVIYNLFARWTAVWRARLADAAAGVERLVSRDLDHDRLAHSPLAAAA